MKIMKLYSANDGKSYFTEIDSNSTIEKELGLYSKQYPVTGLIFREFDAGAEFHWHNAPQPQYIIYLEGKVEIETSSGETRVFQPGDVLLAMDLTGQGHITRTLTKGKSIVVTTE